ncbi:MAG: ABC transporter substrate-binding protein [Truepera sp.]|nr:ABC transporter substrate-binding protein [Truepera sp.]
MKKLLTLLAVLLLSGALAQPQVSNVGVLLDYTGALAEFGPAMRNSAELAAAQINAAAEAVFGGPIIRLIHEDSATSAAVGADRARKLIDVDGVVAIVGSLASSVTVAVAEAVTAPARVVQISPASTSPLLTFLNDNDFLFRTTASDALQGVVAGQLARGEIVPGYSFDTAATIFVNNPYGQGLNENFVRSFEARGGRVLAAVPHPEEPQPTYAAQLEQALAGNPDVLVAISYPGQATVYLAESRDLFGFTSWQFVDGTKSIRIIEALGAETVEGLLGTAPGADPEWAGNELFLAAHEAAYGTRPALPFNDTVYDAVAVIGLAIAKAYLDGVEITGEAVRDRLREVSNAPGEVVGVGAFEEAFRLLQRGVAINYTGAAGEVDFDQHGDVLTPVEIWRYAGGAIEVVAIRRADEIPLE